MTSAATTSQVQEALARTDIMALSTVDEDGGSWTSPVQFQHDDSLHLYFASLEDARHVRNIRRDRRVSVAIYSYPGPPGGNLGLQIKGAAEPLPHGGGAQPDGWQRFRITAGEAWLFDSRVDRRRHRIDLSGLSLRTAPTVPAEGGSGRRQTR
jgi:predicted pyridoxine 5'-phosphate oxidase superfamily flavin-nucleotide-binding protein